MVTVTHRTVKTRPCRSASSANLQASLQSALNRVEALLAR